MTYNTNPSKTHFSYNSKKITKIHVFSMNFNHFVFSQKFTSRILKIGSEQDCGGSTVTPVNRLVAAVPLTFCFIVFICVYLSTALCAPFRSPNSNFRSYSKNASCGRAVKNSNGTYCTSAVPLRFRFPLFLIFFGMCLWPTCRSEFLLLIFT